MVLISKAKYIPVNKHNMLQKGFFHVCFGSATHFAEGWGGPPKQALPPSLHAAKYIVPLF